MNLLEIPTATLTPSPNQAVPRGKSLTAWLLGLLTVLTGALAMFGWFIRHRLKPPLERRAFKPQVSGLSEAEVAQRRDGTRQQAIKRLERQQTMEVWRTSIFSVYQDLFYTIFSLVPAGFFLMVIVNYAMGTIDLARKGALVHRQRMVETLAQITRLCLIRENGLLGFDAQLEMLPTSSGEQALPENLVRHLLGDIGRSVMGSGSANKVYLDALAVSFAGDPRPVKEEAFFLSLLGWGALSWDTPERRGVYVLGYPEAMAAYLEKAMASAVPLAKKEKRSPRLPEQPIFYPVLNFDYAEQIARDWNATISPFAGFVTRFEVEQVYAETFEIHTFGGQIHQELWVPAEALPEFNRHIIGKIEVVATYYGDKFSGDR